jgi:hypothetical protein
MKTIISENIKNILHNAETDFKIFREKLGSRMSAKLQSEIISGLVENAFEKVIPEARVGNGDREADVYINGVPLELKTSRKSREWRGGEFSKRFGDFLLISWDITPTGNIGWCVAHAILAEEDWQSSKSASYYATTISLDNVLDKGCNIIVGNTRKAKTRTHPVYEVIEIN